MWLKKLKGRLSTFYTQLILLFVIFFVIMQVLNFYSNWTLRRSFEQSLASLQVKVSSVVLSSINKVFDEMFQANYFISLDNNVQTTFSSYAVLSEKDYYLFPQVMRTLSSVTAYSDFIEGIAIYRRDDGMVISDKSVYSDIEYFNLYHRYENYDYNYWKSLPDAWRNFALLTPTLNYSYDIEGKMLLPTLYRGIFGSYSDNLFIVDLNYQAIQEMIDGYLTTPNSSMYILDENFEKILFTSTNSLDIQSEELTFEGSHEEPFFRKKINGANYIAVVQKGNIDLQSVNVVTMIPYADISETLKNNTQNSFWGSLLLNSIIAFSLTIILAKKAYTPVKQLLQTTKANHIESNESEFDVLQRVYHNVEQALSSVKKQLENTTVIAKEQVLRKVLLGKKLSDGEIRYMQNVAKWIDGCQIVIIQPIFKQTLYEDFSEEFSEDIMNIIKNILPSIFDFCKNWSVEIDGRFFILIDGNESQQQQIYEACKKMIDIFQEDENYLSLIVLIDDEQVSFENIANYYKTALNHITNVSLIGASRIIYADQKELEGKITLTDELEGRLGNWLATGKMDEIDRFLDGIRDQYMIRGFSICDMSDMVMQIYLVGMKTMQQHNLVMEESMASSFSDFTANLQTKSLDMVLIYLRSFLEQIASQCSSVNVPLKFQTFSSYLQANFDKDISMDILAARYHASPQYISRLIKKEVGMTYQSYLNHLRIEKAQDLLITTDLSVTEIYERVGYHSRNAFIRTFKAICGITPTEYRKVHLNNK